MENTIIMVMISVHINKCANNSTDSTVSKLVGEQIQYYQVLDRMFHQSNKSSEYEYFKKY